MTSTQLKVTGMTCGHCRSAVERALKSQPGVTEANVDLEKGAADVKFDEKAIAVETLIAAVEGEGYQASTC
ncbi:MAG: cation transporter [Gemmatimonadota bacterium]|jgi:copper chaperone|nr:cation transporter [Gemmatimonadota bacterium]